MAADGLHFGGERGGAEFDAEAFYLRHGFKRLPVDAPTLALDLLKLARL